MRQQAYVIPIEFTPKQHEVDVSPARFKVWYGGRRCGKTEYELYWSIKHFVKRGSTNWIVAPDKTHGRRNLWDRLKAMVPRGLVKSINETGMLIRSKRDSELQILGSENPTSLRGRKLYSLVMEEAAFQKENVYHEVLRASLSDLKGDALFPTSPRGKNWLYKLYELGLAKKDKDWAAFHSTIYDNPHIERDEIEKIKRSVSDSIWKQEYLAEITENAGQVYPEFNEMVGTFSSDPFLDAKNHVLVRGIDFAMSVDDTAVVWLHIMPTGHVIATEEFVQNNWSIPRLAETINHRTGSRVVQRGHDVLSWDSWKTDPTTLHTGGNSVAKEFHKHGILAVPSVKDIATSTEVVKRFLGGNTEGPFVLIGNCPKLIEALKTHEYGEHEPDALAAFRYGLYHIYVHKLSKLFNGTETVKSGLNHGLVLPNGQRFLNRRHQEDMAWSIDEGQWA